MANTNGSKLTDKQAKFVDEYLIDLNGTQAAIRAGYSENTASEIAYENLKKPQIIEALNSRREAIEKSTEITQERILKEYARIGFGDIRNAVKWRSNVLTAALDPDTGEPSGIHVTDVEFFDSEELDDDVAAAISEVKKDARGGLSIKLYDKKAALDSMAKHLGMFDGKSGPDGDSDKSVGDDLRSVARDIAFVLRRAVEQAKA